MLFYRNYIVYYNVYCYYCVVFIENPGYLVYIIVRQGVLKSTRNRRPRALAVAFRASDTLARPRGLLLLVDFIGLALSLTNLERHTKSLHGNHVKLELTRIVKRLRP